MATRIVTLNEILDLFKQVSVNHYQLNDFGYGPTSEIGTSRQMEFPYLWITHQTDSYIRLNNKTIIPEIKMTLIVADQINDQSNYEDINGLDSNNGQEISSDCFQIIQDIITYINNNQNFRNLGVNLVDDDDIRIFPAYDDTTDKVNSWAAEITLRLSYINCDLPIEPFQSN